MNNNPDPSSPFYSKYPSLPTHLQIAFSQLGTFEYTLPHKVKTVLGVKTYKSNPQIEKYLSCVGMPSDDKIPWCSAFVNWCLMEAGLTGTHSALARSFLSWGIEIDSPQPGDIVVIRRGVSKVKGHVYFYLDHGKGWIYGIGGNQNDRVGVNTYSSLRHLSYRRAV